MGAFISGGSRGIGRSIVERLVRDGHDVAFTYRSGKDEAEKLLATLKKDFPKRKCLAFPLDIRDSAQVDQIVAQAIEALGDVEILVANAGIASNGLALYTEDDDWNEALATNLSGTFFLCRAFLQHFVGNRYGRIVLLSSITRNGASGQIAYATTKAGLVGMGMTIAKEYGAKGITCNIVAPGYIETEMTKVSASDRNNEYWAGTCPVGRIGKPEEVASAVAYLCAKDASFVNGSTLTVNGGLDWLP